MDLQGQSFVRIRRHVYTSPSLDASRGEAKYVMLVDRGRFGERRQFLGRNTPRVAQRVTRAGSRNTALTPSLDTQPAMPAMPSPGFEPP